MAKEHTGTALILKSNFKRSEGTLDLSFNNEYPELREQGGRLFLDYICSDKNCSNVRVDWAEALKIL